MRKRITAKKAISFFAVSEFVKFIGENSDNGLTEIKGQVWTFKSSKTDFELGLVGYWTMKRENYEKYQKCFRMNSTTHNDAH